MSGVIKGKTLSQSDTKIEALSLQSSAFGVTIPLLYGVNRIAGNLIWYGGFKATPHTTSQTAGKGGGVKTQNTTYTYSASLMMGLCEGQISGVSRIWKGKALAAGGPTPAQIVTASQSYLIPGGGGTLTVTNAATFSANISVSGMSGLNDVWTNVLLAEGTDYTRVGGVYTFVGTWAGLTVSVAYQYLTGGGSQTALQALGLSFASGALGQSAWSFLSTFTPATPPGGAAGSQSLGYSGLAYVYAQDYSLGSTASVDNHTFEVQGPQAYTVSTTIPDANPVTVTQDILGNGRYGAAFPSAQLGTVTAWSNYCLASGILLSPAITEQMQASELVALMCKLTNTAPVWSGGKLKTIPYGDSNLTCNGATYTANVTPVYDLTDDDFIGDGGDPIKVKRKPQADAYNHIRVEFCNRANLYNIEIAEAKDSAAIDAFGLRSAEIVSAHWICDAAVARTVAQLLLQRTLFVRNTYEFMLPWTKVLLEAMDLVTLTDAGLGFNKLPARIVSIAEDESGYLAVEAEEFPLGVASASLYQNQPAVGFQHDYNAAPGSVSAPVIFEAPGALTVNGLELYVAATGVGSAWGGCNVWVSLDGTTYKQIGTLHGGSRYGTLNGAPSGGNVHVALLTGQLNAGSASDAAALNTLCYIGGASKEFFSYQAATLTSALHYDLQAIVIGAYGTTAGGHSNGDPFVRVDTAIAKSGPIDLGYVGKTVHVKLTSFNIYGAAEESLASVTDYTYTISGSQVYGNAGAAALASIGAIASDNVLSAGEKPAVILDVTNITNEYAGIVAQAAALSVSTTAYTTAYTALVSTYLPGIPFTAPYVAWNTLTGDTIIVGTTFRSTFAAYYSARQSLENAIVAANKALADAAQGTASSAASSAATALGNAATALANASAAQTAANTANTALANIASDSILSPSEKPAVKLDYDNIIAEQSGIDAQAAATGFATPCASLKTTYDTAVSALTTYLGTLTGWNTIPGSDVAIVGTTFRTKFVDVYAARQALLNQIAATAATLAAWAGVAGRPAMFRACTYGASSTTLPASPYGLSNAETGAGISGINRSYQVILLDRSTGALISSKDYDVYGVGAVGSHLTAADMASDLAAITGNSTIVVVLGSDEPQAHRLDGALPTAMYLHGASRAVFGSPEFKVRAAYVLVSISNCGEGNGFESYNGAVNNDTNAWCDVSFYLQNGQLVITGTGATPRTLADFSYSGDLAATKNIVTYSGSAPGSPANGDVWVDTSGTQPVTKVRVAGAWQTGATVGATWGVNINGSNLPANNATVGGTFGVNITGQAATGDIGYTAVSDKIAALAAANYDTLPNSSATFTTATVTLGTYVSAGGFVRHSYSGWVRVHAGNTAVTSIQVKVIGYRGATPFSLQPKIFGAAAFYSDVFGNGYALSCPFSIEGGSVYSGSAAYTMKMEIQCYDSTGAQVSPYAAGVTSYVLSDIGLVVQELKV